MTEEIKIITKVYDEASQQFKKIGVELQKVVDGVKTSTKAFSTYDKEGKKLSTTFQQTTKQFKAFTSLADMGIRTIFPKTSSGFKNIDDVLGDLSKKTVKFRMELLSLMFGLQMINRGLMRIGTSAIAEFKRAHESTGFWNSSIGQLSIGFTMIKIAMGEMINQAMGPLIEKFMNILPLIIDFIAKNEELVTAFIILAGLTAIGATIAALSLLADGFAIAIGSTATNTGLAGLQGLASKGVSITIMLMGVKELVEGNTLTGLSGIFGGLGLLLKPGDIATGLIATGLVLGLVDVIKSGEVDLFQRLQLAFFGARIGFAIGGPWGAGIGLVVTIALTELFVSSKVRDAINNWLNALDFKMSDEEFLSKEREGEQSLYPTQQFGGVIPATGLYKMHAGEMVSNPQFSSSVSVNANQMSSSVDVQHLANTVSSVIMRDVKRWVTPVSQYG